VEVSVEAVAVQHSLGEGVRSWESFYLTGLLQPAGAQLFLSLLYTFQLLTLASVYAHTPIASLSIDDYKLKNPHPTLLAGLHVHRSHREEDEVHQGRLI
jgi:hypothetical protein